MTEPATAKPTPIAQYLVLGLAVLIAAGVGAYFFLSGGDDNKDLAFGGTPVSSLPGAPTAIPGTGVLEPNRPKEGERAPDFALVDARDAAKVRKLSDFRGTAMIVNWYASWCDPCTNEIPEFQKAVDALGGQLTVLGVDYLESSDKASGIMKALGATYPAVLDSNAAVADHYRIGRGLPVTFFIDKDGVLQAMKTGEVKRTELGDYLAKIGLTYSAVN
jgi:peroxiredoxin